LALAIALDALIVRTMLVPAIMQTFGRANWYIPKRLGEHLPHLDLDQGPATPERGLVSVG
jgi:RND superfamily putative drug exporter